MPERGCAREVDATGYPIVSVLSLLPRDRTSCTGRSFAVAEERVDAPSEMERRSVGEMDASRAAIERDTRSPMGDSAVLSEVSPNDGPCRSLRAASPLAAAGTGSPVRRASRSAKFWAASAPGPVRGDAEDEVVDDVNDDAGPEPDERGVRDGVLVATSAVC